MVHSAQVIILSRILVGARQLLRRLVERLLSDRRVPRERELRDTREVVLVSERGKLARLRCARAEGLEEAVQPLVLQRLLLERLVFAHRQVTLVGVGEGGRGGKGGEGGGATLEQHAPAAARGGRG